MEHVPWPGAAPTALAVDVLGPLAHPRILVSGDVDAVSAAEVTTTLTGVLHTRPDTLCVDLRTTSFFGAAGLSALIDARETDLGRLTRWRVLVASRTIVCRVFQVTGLGPRLNVVSTPGF